MIWKIKKKYNDSGAITRQLKLSNWNVKMNSWKTERRMNWSHQAICFSLNCIFSVDRIQMQMNVWSWSPHENIYNMNDIFAIYFVRREFIRMPVRYDTGLLWRDRNLMTLIAREGGSFSFRIDFSNVAVWRLSIW